MINKNKKIIYVMKDFLSAYPPCISQIVILRELGLSVEVITEVCDQASMSVLQNVGVTVNTLGNLNPNMGVLGRIAHWVNFKRLAIKKIKELYREGDILWLGSATTGIVLNNYVKNKKFVLNVLELYDTWPLYKKKLGKIIHFAAAVVACELNRARIMKQWYNLSEIPYIMPNKPYYELGGEKTKEVLDFQSMLVGKNYILYQGVLDPERPLDTLANALNKTKNKYKLVIIGSCADKSRESMMIKQLQSIYPDVIYGGYFPPPQHLHITKNAYIGVAIYDTASLNTLFCAPNKIFEYSKFNVPILGSDIPGLQLSIERNGAGICVDIDNSDEITKAIDQISEKYADFQKGAEKLYYSVDNTKTVKTILEKLKFF